MSVQCCEKVKSVQTEYRADVNAISSEEEGSLDHKMGKEITTLSNVDSAEVLTDEKQLTSNEMSDGNDSNSILHELPDCDSDEVTAAVLWKRKIMMH